MKNCLVLLTKAYPFGKGEEFIEDEVPFLAQAFDRVILIATSTAEFPDQTRQVPENVIVRHISAETVKRAIPISGIRYFPYTTFQGYAEQAERKSVGFSLKKRAYLTYFMAKADAVYEECSKILADYSFQDYDGVTFYSYWLYDTALAAVRFKKYSAVKVKMAISRAHRYDLYDYLNQFHYIPMRDYLLKNLDAVYPCSQDGTDYLNRHCPGYEDKIRTAYLGSRDYGLCPPSDGGAVQFVSCCYISPVKRVELLAEAFALLKDSGLRLEWTHFGGGEALEKLKAFAAEKLSFMKTNFPGSVRNEALMDYYSTHGVDWFVNTSSSEGLPVSIMEACSFGIPAVATDVGGTSEIVREPQTGFLVPKDVTEQELADKLAAAAQTTPERHAELRASCRSLWEKNFCAQDNFPRFAEAIQPAL